MKAKPGTTGSQSSRRSARNPDATESPVEDDLVRVYPVRTKLSRFLLHHAEEDCFIKLAEPIDGRFREFSPATRQAIAHLKIGVWPSSQ